MSMKGRVTMLGISRWSDKYSYKTIERFFDKKINWLGIKWQNGKMAKLFYVTYSNLIAGNTKSCQSCGQKKTNYMQECEILEKIRAGYKISHIAKDYNLSRDIIYRIRRENIDLVLK